jgi:hypothetical protein
VWVVAGCGGCALVALLIVVLAANQFGAFFGGFQKDMAAVTPQSIKQDLSGVPEYPGSTLELIETQAMSASLRIVERGMGRQRGALFKGLGVYSTGDPITKVRSFYDAKLKAAGWTRVSASEHHLTFKKAEEYLLIELSDVDSGTTEITIKRGPKEIEEFKTSD